MRFLTRDQRATLYAPIIVLATSIVFATFSVGYAQIPKAEDIAACNADAQRAVRSGTGRRDPSE